MPKILILFWTQTLILAAKINRIINLYLQLIYKLLKIKIICKLDSASLISLINPPKEIKIKSKIFITKLQQNK